jgi:hypothetical protein
MKNSSAAENTGVVGAGLFAVFCPVCWPAIGALFSSIGLGALVSFSAIRPLIALFALLAVWGYVKSYQTHKKAIALWLGILSAIYTVVIYWTLGSAYWIYLGIAGMIIAAVMDVRFKKTCPAPNQEKS